MEFFRWKHVRLFYCGSLICVCVILSTIAVVFRPILSFSAMGWNGSTSNSISIIPGHSSSSSLSFGIRPDKFVEVPQIVWGLNNQKIAFARSCLTARILNRTLLIPQLSASLFYKEMDLLRPISFDKVFQFEAFNSRCRGFVQLARYSDHSSQSSAIDLQKGSGRRWTSQRDLDQLKEFSKDPIDGYDLIRITGKNPFLWVDHWPVKDYAKVFECLVLVEEISIQAHNIISKIRSLGITMGLRGGQYVAVHMRIEKDWMIHCRKLEQRSNTSKICSSKKEIMGRVANISGLKSAVVYLAVADSLLEDTTIMRGWKKGLFPLEKKKLGVDGIYKRYPYLIQSAIDYEVCLNADIFVGNSFSTFSSLIVLERTLKMKKMGITSCSDDDLRWASYAYNIPGKLEGPQRWMTNMSDSSFQAVSYGSVDISCRNPSR